MTTPEELRTLEIKGCDAVLDAPWIVRKLLSADNLRLVRANRTYWQQATTSDLERLGKLFDAEPRRAETEGSPTTMESCGWLPGPLPPNTWNWGGVVLVGETPIAGTYGFQFADFAGDHVKIETSDGWKRVEADQVLFWNNCLRVPGDKGGGI